MIRAYLVAENQICEGEEDDDERKDEGSDCCIYEPQQEIQLYPRFCYVEIDATGIHCFFPVLFGLDYECVFQVEQNERNYSEDLCSNPGPTINHDVSNKEGSFHWDGNTHCSRDSARQRKKGLVNDQAKMNFHKNNLLVDS